MIDIAKELQKYNLTEDRYEQCLKDVSDKMGNFSDLDWVEIRDKNNLKIHYDSLRKASQTIFGGYFVSEYYKQKNLKNQKDNDIEEIKNNYCSEVSINKDGSQTSSALIEMSKEQAKDVDYLLSVHGFCNRTWELVSAKNNIWNAYSKQDGTLTLYSSKITVKPRTNISNADIEDFYKNLSEKYKTPSCKVREVDKNGYMLEVPIVDLHLSKLSLEEDVVNGYDIKKARQNFNFIIDDVIEQTKHLKICKIIFPVGNDFFNTDTVGNTTTHGTPQDNDLSWQQLFLKGVEVLIDGITKLSKIAPVEVFCVNGNHDFMTSFHALSSLYYYFLTDENVYVDMNTSPRHYIKFGKNLIGFTHGDKEKRRIDGIMQVEASESWGKTLFREWHMAHLHSEQTVEKNGVIIRNLSSVTGTDAWHHIGGYVGSIRKSQSFVWDRNLGIKTIIHSTISD